MAIHAMGGRYCKPTLNWERSKIFNSGGGLFHQVGGGRILNMHNHPEYHLIPIEASNH
jgi:hypothetical protein